MHKQLTVILTISFILLTPFLFAQNTKDRGEREFHAGLRQYVKKEYTKAFDFFKQASDLGNATADLYIGTMYFNGFGVEKNAKKAFDWYLRSADQLNTQDSISGRIDVLRWRLRWTEFCKIGPMDRASSQIR